MSVETSPARRCVLLVDDEDDALVFARRLVEQAMPTATVVTVHSTREAMNYLLRATNPTEPTTQLPAVMLLDVHLPGMSGFELLRWVRHNQSLAKVKVVMLSTSDSPTDIKLATELGANGYLIKYPNPSCLAALLKQAAAPTEPASSAPPVA